MSAIAAADDGAPNPAPLVACTVCRDLNSFEGLIAGDGTPRWAPAGGS